MPANEPHETSTGRPRDLKATDVSLAYPCSHPPLVSSAVAAAVPVTLDLKRAAQDGNSLITVTTVWTGKRKTTKHVGIELNDYFSELCWPP